MLDGYPVNIGDVVYSLGVGTGTVTAVNADGGFSVKHGNGEVYYRDGGYIGNKKRVYWADPLIIVPPKDRRVWRAFCKIVVSLWGQLNTFTKLGADDVEEV